MVVNIIQKKKANMKREITCPNLEFDRLESSTQFILSIRCSLELRVMSEAQLGNAQHLLLLFPPVFLPHPQVPGTNVSLPSLL